MNSALDQRKRWYAISIKIYLSLFLLYMTYQFAAWVNKDEHFFAHWHQNSCDGNIKENAPSEMKIWVWEFLHPQHVFYPNHFVELYFLVNKHQEQEGDGADDADAEGERWLLQV